MKPRDWCIYAYAWGWVAWNARTRRSIELVAIGSFSEAVSAFERRIGEYWGSR
jgi:hypothetical protein